MSQVRDAGFRQAALQRARALRAQGVARWQQQTSEELGVGTNTLRVWMRADEADDTPRQIPLPLEDAHTFPEFDDKKFAKLDIWEAFDAIEKLQGVVGDSSTGQHDAKVTIQTEQPIILLPTSDWHLGSYATDYASFRKYLDLVLNTPNAYLLLLGDAVDNFPASFKSAAAVFSQVIPPQIQHRVYTKILVELAVRGKIIARTWGNHEEMTERHGGGGADYAYDELLPYLKTMGRLRLTVGATEYKVFASHTFPGKSYLHANHQNKRAVRFLWPEADMALSGDTHQGPEHEEFIHDGRHRISVLCGTFKTDDTYSKRYYGNAQKSDQAIVLFPDRHHMVPFRCMADALIYVKGCKGDAGNAA